MPTIGMLTKEWPPDVYGGAGVHVTELTRHLRHQADVTVHCFGTHRMDAVGHDVRANFGGANAALQTLAVDLEMAAALEGQPVEVVHSHTWYANMAGVVAGELLGVPHILTSHSLEPARPWKAEQLGGGYRLSCWAEETAYRQVDAVIAVSAFMRHDILRAYPFVDPDRLHVIPNGIDTVQTQPLHDPDLVREYSVDPDGPYVLFVGRITRQKGLLHLLRAAKSFDPRCALVLCAAAPDTPEIAAETATAIAELTATRGNVTWIREPAPRHTLLALLTGARAFICPSVYEPMGIVNLEAMATSTAVIASDVGGIPEVVQDGTTGLLAHYDAEHTDEFEAEVARLVNELVADPARADALGASGRTRAVDAYSWDSVARRTLDVYESTRA